MNKTKLTRHTYKLKTLSTLILSPREHNGFYAAADDFAEEGISCSRLSAQGEGKKPNIIYPFYQYGEYQSYRPETVQYYIPGSSVKGALRSAEGNKNAERIMVDDIRLERANIHLRNLHKIQNLSMLEPDSTKQIKLEIFFPNVAIEMLDAGAERCGTLFCEGNFEEHLARAQQDTICKVRQLCQQIDSIKKESCSEELKEMLDRLRGNLQNISKEAQTAGRAYLFLGGYKGLLLSNLCESAAVSQGRAKQTQHAAQDADIRSAIYFDRDKCLPHGLVSMEIVESD